MLYQHLGLSWFQTNIIQDCLFEEFYYHLSAITERILFLEVSWATFPYYIPEDFAHADPATRVVLDL